MLPDDFDVVAQRPFQGNEVDWLQPREQVTCPRTADEYELEPCRSKQMKRWQSHAGIANPVGQPDVDGCEHVSWVEFSRTVCCEHARSRVQSHATIVYI